MNTFLLVLPAPDDAVPPMSAPPPCHSVHVECITAACTWVRMCSPSGAYCPQAHRRPVCWVAPLWGTAGEQTLSPRCVLYAGSHSSPGKGISTPPPPQWCWCLPVSCCVSEGISPTLGGKPCTELVLKSTSSRSVRPLFPSSLLWTSKPCRTECVYTLSLWHTVGRHLFPSSPGPLHPCFHHTFFCSFALGIQVCI